MEEGTGNFRHVAGNVNQKLDALAILRQHSEGLNVFDGAERAFFL